MTQLLLATTAFVSVGELGAGGGEKEGGREDNGGEDAGRDNAQRRTF